MIKIYKSFIRETANLVLRAEYVRDNVLRLESCYCKYLTEGLVSDLWLRWCLACKQIVLSSCRGCLSRNSIFYNERFGDNSWQRIGYEARQACQNNRITPNRTISSLRQEPTWGDRDNIIAIIQSINPSNSSNLLAGFGLPLHGPRHLQIVRNACYHKNWETMNDIRSLSMHFLSPTIKSPSDLTWQVYSASSQLAYFVWIDDLRNMLNVATS
jgi:hypothetical protein